MTVYSSQHCRLAGGLGRQLPCPASHQSTLNAALIQNSTGAAPSEAVAASASSSERKRGNGKGDRKLKDGGAKQGSGSGGGGTSGTRRKRWRPEELDPMIAAEDAELKVGERLLRPACGREGAV